MQAHTITLETHPDVKAQWLLEGNTYYQVGRYEEAVISYARAIQCDPTCQSAFHNLGSSLLRLRRFEEAFRAFQGAARLNPHDATTHCDLGDVLSELTCNEEALRAYATSLQLDPWSARTYNNLGVLLDQIQNWEGASRAFAHAVQLDPGDAVSNYNLSRILTQIGKTEEAKQAYHHPAGGRSSRQIVAVRRMGKLRKLAQPVLSRGYPVHFILTGTPGERPLLEEIARETTARTTVLTGMTIGKLAAVFQQAQLVLGVASGPLHLAVALGIPTVRLYGPIDPHIFGPWGSEEQHSVIVSTSRCTSCAAIPCGHLSFPEHELIWHPCVKLVPEQQVRDAIVQQLPLLVRGIPG